MGKNLVGTMSVFNNCIYQVSGGWYGDRELSDFGYSREVYSTDEGINWIKAQPIPIDDVQYPNTIIFDGKALLLLAGNQLNRVYRLAKRTDGCDARWGIWNKYFLFLRDDAISYAVLDRHDSTRHRNVPVAVYRPDREMEGRGVVIFSHGYWANQPGAYRAYGYLTEFLAAQGYFVVSVQHELPTDSLIPSEGVPQVVRRPFWERGADNIRFVIEELRRSHPTLDLSK